MALCVRVNKGKSRSFEWVLVDLMSSSSNVEFRMSIHLLGFLVALFKGQGIIINKGNIVPKRKCLRLSSGDKETPTSILNLVHLKTLFN